MPPVPFPQKPAERFNKLFRTNPGRSPLEARTDTTPMTESQLFSQADKAEQELSKMLEFYKVGDPKLKGQVKKLIADGKAAMKAVAQLDNEPLEKNRYQQASLEVIARTDGSRPSFVIQEDEIRYESNPGSLWESVLIAAGKTVNQAIRSVGRINQPNGAHLGTGYLVQNNFIITNRHVFQEMATFENDGTWLLIPNHSIDFGHEYESRQSVNNRKIISVAFVAKGYVSPENLGTHLDLVLLELATAPLANIPDPVFSIDKKTDWAKEHDYVFTIGYPAQPSLEDFKYYGVDVLWRIMRRTYGYKHIAPGVVLPKDGLPQWSFGHDASTLGGCSGSVVVSLMSPFAAGGVHYGGTLRAPAQNWGHLLGGEPTLTTKDMITGRPLEEILQEKQIRFV